MRKPSPMGVCTLSIPKNEASTLIRSRQSGSISMCHVRATIFRTEESVIRTVKPVWARIFGVIGNQVNFSILAVIVIFFGAYFSFPDRSPFSTRKVLELVNPSDTYDLVDKCGSFCDWPAGQKKPGAVGLVLPISLDSIP